MSTPLFRVSRRDFLRHGLAAGGGLTLGIVLGTNAAAKPGGPPAAVATDAFAPNAFVRIGTDSTVTVIAKHVEFGQGTFTGLPTLVAEELDADWSQMRVEAAPADAKRYANLNWGAFQGTGGSSSINNAYTQMRTAGATARAMLVAAAAAAWQVPADAITVSKGVIRHAASGRSAAFGEFAVRAAALPVPADVALKDPADFVLIGGDVPRTDQRAKADGSAVYTQDLSLPGMLTALVAHPPRFGATVRGFDAARALRVKGVAAVHALPGGVAVVARDFWSARKGRDALTVDWDESGAFRGGTDAIRTQFRSLAGQPGLLARRDGDPERAFEQAAQVIEADYEFPYLAHAAMEPMNCIAQVTEGACELWYGAQGLTGDQNNVAAALGIAPERVTIHMLFAGGSFGRRSHRQSDYVVEAAQIAQAHGGGVPIKLVWTREDDMRAGAYRPFTYHRVRGAIDENGNITAWQQRIVAQSILARSDAIDKTLTEGAADLPYAIPNMLVEAHQPVLAVPVLWWRSVGHTHTAFATECFLDELAHAAGRDPLALRLALLAGDPRRREVLERAARDAGWGQPLAAGRGRGIAVHKAFKTWVAEVAEVTAHGDGEFSVDKVTVAVDCGIAVNPDIVRAQMEGGVGYALSAATGEAVTLEDGVVQQDNFDTYPLLRFSRMPEVSVHIVASDAHPTGVGEPGVPPLAPAVANALFAATGTRRRALPLDGGRAS